MVHTLHSRIVSKMSPGSQELSAPYTRTTSRDACDGRALSRLSASINEFWIDACEGRRSWRTGRVRDPSLVVLLCLFGLTELGVGAQTPNKKELHRAVVISRACSNFVWQCNHTHHNVKLESVSARHQRNEPRRAAPYHRASVCLRADATHRVAAAYCSRGPRCECTVTGAFRGGPAAISGSG